MNHRVGRLIFGVAVGLIAAMLVYQCSVNPAPRAERQLQERVVVASRGFLVRVVDSGELEIVDPVAPDGIVGKTYVYRADDGWEVSGFYRRDENDLWHPYLMTLTSSLSLAHLKISDPGLRGRDLDGLPLEIMP